MQKIAMYIPKPGLTPMIVQHGYVDAMEYLDWKVYAYDPETKMECSKFIEEYGVRLIFTGSKYGIRQLPIDIINRNKVKVIVAVSPQTPIPNENPYDCAHEDERDILSQLDAVVLHTHIRQDLFDDFFKYWTDTSMQLLHIPFAGNIMKSMPQNCNVLTDMAMVCNFLHKQEAMKYIIEPLCSRLSLLEYSYQAFGDDIWRRAGLLYNGPLLNLNMLPQIYGTALVCPNVHTVNQLRLGTYVNERSFSIPLCGGMQVVDNPLAVEYLGDHVDIAATPTAFIQKVISLIENPSQRFARIAASVEHIANNHTFFNRLCDLFAALGLFEEAGQASSAGKNRAIHHCWDINARLDAEKEGVSYGQGKNLSA